MDWSILQALCGRPNGLKDVVKCQKQSRSDAELMVGFSAGKNVSSGISVGTEISSVKCAI